MTAQRGRTPVLVVEDDPILMMSLVDFVEEAGFEAIEASDADHAMELLETRDDIRTVFTDLDTRNAEAGMRMALAIRDRWPSIELLMISSQAWSVEGLPLRGVLLDKPFDQRRIVATLRHLTA